MNLFIYLTIGAIVGSIVSGILKTNSWLGMLVNMIEGVVGAFLAGYFISPLLKVGTLQDTITLPTLLVTIVGSIVMIWIVGAVHHHDTDDRPVLDSTRTNRRG